MGGIPAGIEPCPSFIDSATRWRADSRSVVFISRFSFPFGICLPIPTVHLVRLLGAVTTCGLWGDLVGWPLFILLPRAEKKDIYLKLIHHQHVLSFFFFYFNIQMALIARVAEFFFCQKSVIILNHRTRWSSSGLRFAAAKEWPTQESHVECQSIPPPPPVGRKSAPPPPEGGHHDIELCKVRWLPSMWCENDSELEGGSA